MAKHDGMKHDGSKEGRSGMIKSSMQHEPKKMSHGGGGHMKNEGGSFMATPLSKKLTKY